MNLNSTSTPTHILPKLPHLPHPISIPTLIGAVVLPALSLLLQNDVVVVDPLRPEMKLKRVLHAPQRIPSLSTDIPIPTPIHPVRRGSLLG